MSECTFQKAHAWKCQWASLEDRKNCALPKMLNASGKFLLPLRFVPLIIWIFVLPILLVFVLDYTNTVRDPSLTGNCLPKFPVIHYYLVDTVKFWPWNIPSFFTEDKQNCNPCDGKSRKQRHLTTSLSCEIFISLNIFREKNHLSLDMFTFSLYLSMNLLHSQMQVWQPQPG